MKIPKKILKKIEQLSVYDDVLKDRLTGDYFADSPPDTWNSDESEKFDLATEVEYQFKKKVLEILTL